MALNGGAISSPRHFAMSGEIFDCHNLGGDMGLKWVEARDSAKHPTMYRTALNSKESSPPKYQ